MKLTDTTRRRFLATVGGTAAGAAALGTASARRGARGDTTIVDLATDADGFETLVAAVTEAGLVDTLSANRQLTVFAPTDEAFAELGVTADNVGAVDFEAAVGATLGEILTYHVTPGRRYAASIVNAPRFSTLNGADVEVDGTVLNGGQAEIVQTNLEASNGVVHVIDGVLLPP